MKNKIFTFQNLKRGFKDWITDFLASIIIAIAILVLSPLIIVSSLFIVVISIILAIIFGIIFLMFKGYLNYKFWKWK